MRIQLAALASLASVFTAVGPVSAAELKLGKPLAVKDPVSIATLLSHAGDYVGKTVQVKGKIAEVCQMMGCWMNLTNDDGQMVRIKVDDGDIVFPKDSAGREAVAEGKFARIELTREEAVAQAREEAEEKGRKFDPASVKGGIAIYQIQGTGAVIR